MYELNPGVFQQMTDKECNELLYRSVLPNSPWGCGFHAMQLYREYFQQMNEKYPVRLDLQNKYRTVSFTSRGGADGSSLGS